MYKIYMCVCVTVDMLKKLKFIKYFMSSLLLYYQLIQIGIHYGISYWMVINILMFWHFSIEFSIFMLNEKIWIKPLMKNMLVCSLRQLSIFWKVYCKFKMWLTKCDNEKNIKISSNQIMIFHFSLTFVSIVNTTISM